MKALNNGFTLFEVMVAMAILAIASLTFIDSQSGAVRMASSMRAKTVAAIVRFCIFSSVVCVASVYSLRSRRNFPPHHGGNGDASAAGPPGALAVL